MTINYRDKLLDGVLERLGRHAFGTLSQREFLVDRLAEILCTADLDEIGGQHVRTTN